MKTAFVFPGQGSQAVGMGKGLAENLLDEANRILGFDLKKLCFEGPEEDLKRTEITQPAILTVSVAAYEHLKNKGVKPEVVAGHSLGEYSALVAAGALKFADAVKLVYLRGKFMQEAVPLGKGAMAAVIGGERSLVESICREVGGVQPANLNGGGQIVISGLAGSVASASEKMKAAGIRKIIPLKVSAPFHSKLMQPAADKLKAELNKIEIRDAQIPVIANVTAEAVKEGARIKELLIEQVTGPVLWEDSVRKMIQLGVKSFIEVGPGGVLAGLIKKIDNTVEVKSYVES